MERLPLAVCIIARNEAHTLPRCLDSIAGIASQVVVVDTGSDDDTIAIAEHFGAEVYRFAWQDDFAAARNESLRHARQPWVLVLDADERLVTPAEVSVLSTIPADVGGLLVTVRSVTTAGASSPTPYATQVLRLFRNDPRLRYEGIIHEQVLPSLLRAGYRCLPSRIGIEHDGYNLDPAVLRAKQERNVRLLDRALAADPLNAFYRFHRAKTLMALGGELDRAREDLAVALQTAQRDGILLPQVLNYAALLAARQNQWHEAIAYAERSLAVLPGQPMSWFLIGEAQRALGNPREALHAYQQTATALDREDDRIRIVGTLRIPRDELAVRMGRMEQALGNPTAAAEHYRAALAQNPANISATQLLEEVMALDTTSAPLLTLAMIVRNEEHTLPRCLESVRGIVDQVVIVDTGSSDGTVAVAEQFGAEVYHFDWCDDFAAARNESLRYAKGRWILYLDADETLTPESAAQLRALLAAQPSHIGGLLCTIVSPHRQANGGVETHRGAYPRLFRNYGYPRIAFRGRVHEQITPAILECGGVIVQSPIVIWHSGYDVPLDRLDAKVRRNYRLLIEHVQQEPLNAYAWFQLGQTLARMQLIDQAKGAFEFALTIGLSEPLRASAASAMAYLCGVQQRYADALRWAEESLRIVPDQVLALAYKAHALEALGHFEQARGAFAELLARLDSAASHLSVGFEIELDRNRLEQKLRALEARCSALPVNAG